MSTLKRHLGFYILRRLNEEHPALMEDTFPDYLLMYLFGARYKPVISFNQQHTGLVYFLVYVNKVLKNSRRNYQ